MEITYEWLLDQGACYYEELDNTTELGAWLKPKLPITIQQLARMRKIPPADKIWALTRLMTSKQKHLFAVACCREIWHLIEDPRSQKAVEVLEKFAMYG